MYTAAQDQTTSKQQTYKSSGFVSGQPLDHLGLQTQTHRRKEKKASELNEQGSRKLGQLNLRRSYSATVLEVP